MENFLSSNFELIDSTNLELINGGSQSDYDFGYKVGNTIRWLCKEIWYSTLGFKPVY